MAANIIEGDCVEAMAAMEACSVDAVVCDPPYGLEFMGKEWDRLTGVGSWATGTSATGYTDGGERVARPSFSSSRNPCCKTCRKHKRGTDRCECATPDFDEAPADGNRLMQAWHEAWAREALRVLKPGGHLLAFGGTRTYHRLACAIEDAGFEVRDSLLWLYGSGFPKSLDVSKAIDKAERGVPQGGEDPTSVNHGKFKTQATEGKRGVGDDGRGYGAGPGQFMAEAGDRDARELVDGARPWQGWGTALKPAHEPIVVARKPLAGSVAANVLAHGTGALNVDGCRIGTEARPKIVNAGLADPRGEGFGGKYGSTTEGITAEGRWPANVVLSHAEGCECVGERQVGSGERNGTETVEAWECVGGCPVAELDRQSGPSTSRQGEPRAGVNGEGWGMTATGAEYADRGASRFFYTAKASRAERNAGLTGFEKRDAGVHDDDAYVWPLNGDGTPREKKVEPRANHHPTVKPIDLMRWLVRLVTPPGGTILDPFTGSGTTGAAAVLEGFEFIGIEREADYVKIAQARIAFWTEHPTGLPIEAALAAERTREAVRDTGQMDLLA